MKPVLRVVVSVALTCATVVSCASEGIKSVGDVSASGGDPGSGGASVGATGGKTASGGRSAGAGGAPAGATGGSAGGAPKLACALQEITVTPSSLSPTDGCEATYLCDDNRTFDVSCDGENDGTHTSLCSCYFGETYRHVGDLYEGEGPDSCLAAAADCAATLERDPDLGAGGAGGAPEEPPPAIEACVFQSITVTPSELSPTDRCEATYLCNESQTFKVNCGGENDGTNTSLCGCTFDDQHRSLNGESGLFQGEGPESCLAAVAECAEVMKEWNER